MSGVIVFLFRFFLMPDFTYQSVLYTEVRFVSAFKSFFEHIKSKSKNGHYNDKYKNDAHFNKYVYIVKI